MPVDSPRRHRLNRGMPENQKPAADDTSRPDDRPPGKPAKRPEEIGGQKGPEPTRYGDWEKGGRVSDF